GESPPTKAASPRRGVAPGPALPGPGRFGARSGHVPEVDPSGRRETGLPGPLHPGTDRAARRELGRAVPGAPGRAGTSGPAPPRATCAAAKGPALADRQVPLRLPMTRHIPRKERWSSHGPNEYRSAQGRVYYRNGQWRALLVYRVADPSRSDPGQ